VTAIDRGYESEMDTPFKAIWRREGSSGHGNKLSRIGTG